MSNEFEFVTQLSEPLINDQDNDNDFEKQRLDIMKQRAQK